MTSLESPSPKRTVNPGPITDAMDDFSMSLDEEDDTSGVHGIPRMEPIGSANAQSSTKRIAIEMRVIPNGPNGAVLLEVNEALNADNAFLSNTQAILNADDFKHMIQQGIRMCLSDNPMTNQVRKIKQNEKNKTVKYILQQYKPKNFSIIRKLSEITNNCLISSICENDLLGGGTEVSGKSGSIFWYSSDRRFILKSITESEANLLNQISSDYFRYLASHPHSLLCRFYGMFKISTTSAKPSVLRGDSRSSRFRSPVQFSMRFVVMNNVFHGAGPDLDNIEKFDLKGTTEDRFVDGDGKVKKDLNFIDRNFTLGQKFGQLLRENIQSDSSFLNKHGIMDYSLLVGIAPGGEGDGNIIKEIEKLEKIEKFEEISLKNLNLNQKNQKNHPKNFPP